MVETLMFSHPKQKANELFDPQKIPHFKRDNLL
jgi:hypothetical protein